MLCVMNYCCNALKQEFKRLQRAGASLAAVQRSNQRSNAVATNQCAANSTASSSANQQWAWSSGQRSDVQHDEVAANVQHDEVAVDDGTTLQGRRHIEALIDSMGRDESSANGKLRYTELYTFFLF
jgi:hypothetical protein